MSMKSINFTLLLVFIATGFSLAQKNYKYEFTTAEFLKEPDINDKSEEVYPFYNKTYDTMYFVRSHHYDNVGSNKDNFDIWYTYKNNGAWAKASNIKELNNSHNNSIVGIGSVTNSLFVINSYTSAVIRDQGISYTTLKGKKWEKPIPIEFAVDTHHKVYSFFINHSEDIIMITMYNNLSEGHEDLFVSLKSEDGRWRDPIYLGHDINSEGYETSPFLADDRKTLFFTSNGFEGYGDGDIFVSNRLDDTWIHWSEPVNLGKDVNSEKFDGYFSLYENGSYLLSSNRHSKYADVFTGKWELVEVKEDKKKDEQVVVKEVIKETSLMEKLPKNVKIKFDFNSFAFDKARYKADIDDAVSFLNTHPNVGVVVEGNTDKKGDEIYNLVLSHKRATGVANYLKDQLPSKDGEKVMVMPNGEANATSDEEQSRVVVIKYVLLGE